MPKRQPTDLDAALFVMLGFLVFGFLTTQLRGSSATISHPRHEYVVHANFENIGNLKVGAPVKLAGVRIGRIAAISLDRSVPSRAHVTMGLDERYATLPADSRVAIKLTGLLGGNYVTLTPGASAVYLAAESQIESTQSAINMERMIRLPR